MKFLSCSFSFKYDISHIVFKVGFQIRILLRGIALKCSRIVHGILRARNPIDNVAKDFKICNWNIYIKKCPSELYQLKQLQITKFLTLFLRKRKNNDDIYSTVFWFSLHYKEVLYLFFIISKSWLWNTLLNC